MPDLDDTQPVVIQPNDPAGWELLRQRQKMHRERVNEMYTRLSKVASGVYWQGDWQTKLPIQRSETAALIGALEVTYTDDMRDMIMWLIYALIEAREDHAELRHTLANAQQEAELAKELLKLEAKR